MNGVCPLILFNAFSMVSNSPCWPLHDCHLSSSLAVTFLPVIRGNTNYLLRNSLCLLVFTWLLTILTWLLCSPAFYLWWFFYLWLSDDEVPHISTCMSNVLMVCNSLCSPGYHSHLCSSPTETLYLAPYKEQASIPFTFTSIMTQPNLMTSPAYLSHL